MLESLGRNDSVLSWHPCTLSHWHSANQEHLVGKNVFLEHLSDAYVQVSLVSSHKQPFRLKRFLAQPELVRFEHIFVLRSTLLMHVFLLLSHTQLRKDFLHALRDFSVHMERTFEITLNWR